MPKVKVVVEITSDWLSTPLIGLVGVLVGSFIALISGWMLTSRRLRNESQVERRKVYAALLSESIALIDIAYSFVAASDHFALAKEGTNVASHGLDGALEEMGASRVRLEKVVDQENRSRIDLRARLFEVQLIAPSHLSDLADDLVQVTLELAVAMKDRDSNRENSTIAKFQTAVAAFTALARWDADSPGSWIAPKAVLWFTNRRKKARKIDLDLV